MLNHRCGIIDRKLRVVRENTATSAQFLTYAKKAYECTYGFEWQGDNLLLAREAMLYTFVDNYKDKFGKMPPMKSMMYIAYVIGWNLFQMDGLKFVVPDSCHATEYRQPKFDGTMEVIIQECPGCRTGDKYHHNGIYSKVRDWRKWHDLKTRDEADQTFVSLF